MIIAVWLLGVGTLKDLALVMLVGVVCGAYGSIFFATPLLVTMRERTELVRTHTRRVMNRRKGAVAKAGSAERQTTSLAPTSLAPSRRHRWPALPRREQAGAGCAADPADQQQDRTARGQAEHPATVGPMTARLRGTAAAVTVALACVVSVSSCSANPAGEIAYAVDGTLTTYNTNTVAGSASGGPQAFARVLTGFNYHGPDGQIVGDHDFGTISVVGRAPLVLDYVISDKAVYSDGKPVTCDDLVLAWASQSGRFPGFEAANQAGYREIASVDCAPGQKRARVSFAPDRAIVDFGQLFVATSMMPSHVISDELGLGEGRHNRPHQQRRPERRSHREGVEQHLESDPGPRPEEVPVVRPLQAGVGH